MNIAVSFRLTSGSMVEEPFDVHGQDIRLILSLHLDQTHLLYSIQKLLTLQPTWRLLNHLLSRQLLYAHYWISFTSFGHVFETQTDNI